MSEQTEFKEYRRKQIAELRPYIDGEILDSSISISQADKDNGSPKAGDMIARNPKNHNDQWLVAKQYFEDNFEPLENTPNIVFITKEQKKELNIIDENFKKIEEIAPELTNDEKEEGEEDLDYEPEDCEFCKEEFENNGIEYTRYYNIKDRVAVCEHCGRTM